MAKKRRPGPRKFWPRRLTARQIQEGNRLYAAARARAAAAAPRITDYKKFCRANSLDPKNLDENIFYLVAQQRDDDLGPRTIKRYSLLLKGRLSLGDGKPTFADFLDVLNVEMIGAPRRHAEDFDEPTLLKILTYIYTQNPYAGVSATMMIWTGLRYKDLVYLSWDCIEIKYEYIRIDVSRTKAIRSEILRTELVIPRAMWPSPSFFALLQKADAWMRSNRTTHAAPEDTGANDLNQYLDDAWVTLGGSGRHPTTYTFRRAAFHRFIETLRGPTGVVPWKRVADLSLHLNEKTVKAFYHLGVSGKVRTEEL